MYLPSKMNNSWMILCRLFINSSKTNNHVLFYGKRFIINRRMPKCNIVLQSENDIFVHGIQPNSHGNC